MAKKFMGDPLGYQIRIKIGERIKIVNCVENIGENVQDTSNKTSNKTYECWTEIEKKEITFTICETEGMKISLNGKYLLNINLADIHRTNIL